MTENLKKLEKIINSELASKVLNSFVENDELTVEISETNLVQVVQFFKSNEKIIQYNNLHNQIFDYLICFCFIFFKSRDHTTT